MTISEEILTAANTLANSGKQPTVALIKTKLSQRVPLPVIIDTLKNWQHDPSYTKLTVNLEKNENKKDSQKDENAVAITAAINTAMAPIKAELAEIKQLIIELQSKK